MLLVKCQIGVMLNLIQHLLWIVEIAGQARNDAVQNKKNILRHNIINLTVDIKKSDGYSQRYLFMY